MTTKQFLGEIREVKTGKYRDYLEMGKQMDTRRMLTLLVDMFMSYCGVSLGYRTVVYDLGWAVFVQYAASEDAEFTGDEPFCTALSRLHPGYTEEYDEYDVGMLEDKEYPIFCMDILDEYAGDDEKCAAICYGLNRRLNDCLSQKYTKRKRKRKLM